MQYLWQGQPPPAGTPRAGPVGETGPESWSALNNMIRTQLYLKVEFDHLEPKEALKISTEIARTVRRLYAVRHVEIQNSMSEEIHPSEDEDSR